MTMIVENIPDELKSDPRWVLWNWTERDGKPDKPPFDPKTGKPGDSQSPNVWVTFDAMLGFLPDYSGGGFSVTSDCPYTGVDLDDCLNEDGEITPDADRIVKALDSYTERTPSGRGLRVWVRGKLPPGRRRVGKIEMYDSGRYFTVTGDHWPGTPRTIEERQAELTALHLETFGPTETETKPRATPSPASLSDQEVIDKAFRSKHGQRFEALYRGDTSAYGDDDSAADCALCARLAFWVSGDTEAIDRIFRTSGLYRPKWERADYRKKTIDRALLNTTFYNPQYKSFPRLYSGRALANGNGKAVIGEKADDPHRLARIYLGTCFSSPDGPTLLYWNEEWHRWTGLVWKVIPGKEMAAEVTAAIKEEFDGIAARSGEDAVKVTVPLVNNTLQALRGMCLLSVASVFSQPAWIGFRDAGEDLPPPREILPASNLMIHVPSFVDGEPSEIPLTPQFFSPMNLGYPFVKDAGHPVEWLAFLETIWPEDEESISCLQEWMGYLLIPETRFEKSLMIIGPRRSGKGTIIRLIRDLVGHENVVSPTLGQLANNFGLAPLIGKTVAVISDARLSGRSDTQAIIESLLSISGEDPKTIDRKHKESWTGRILTRFVLVSNELPRLGDSSNALTSRFILLQMTNSFLGREDTRLEKRLFAERPAILLWAIQGLARLLERDRFEQPESGLELLRDFEELSSPVGAFVAERCETGPEEKVQVTVLYDEWVRYCKENGKDRPGDIAGFGRMLRSFLPELKIAQPREGEKRVRIYSGIGMRGGC